MTHSEQHGTATRKPLGLKKLSRWERLLVTLRSQHAYEPFFEAGAGCWCNRGPRSWIHKGDRHLADTPLGDAIKNHAL